MEILKDHEKVETIISKIIAEEFVVPIRLLTREIDAAKENENVWTALVRLAAKGFMVEYFLEQSFEVLSGAHTLTEQEVKVQAKNVIMPKLKEVYRKTKLTMGANNE